MHATFRIDGSHEFEIRPDGSLVSADNKLHSFSKGKIGIQIHETPFQIPEPEGRDLPERRTTAAFYVTRSQARAIASALLSAVSEAQ